MESVYISFCGKLKLPHNHKELERKFPMSHYEQSGFRKKLLYDAIQTKDSLTVYLAKIDEKTGHLVADCPAGGWYEDVFVCLLNGKPEKAEDNFNPNPFEQLL